MSKESVENIELTVITPHSILLFVPGDLAVAVDGCHRVGDHHAPGPLSRRTRRTCAEDQRKLGGPKSWLTKFSSLDS